MTARDEIRVPAQAIEHLLAMPAPIFRPLLEFIKNDDHRGRRAVCLAERPALAAHLAIAGSFHPSAAFNARYELDCGYDLDRVARTARFKLPANVDISKLRIEWRGRRPWVTTAALLKPYQTPRPPLFDVKAITEALQLEEGGRI